MSTERPWRELSKQILDYRYQSTVLSHNAMVALETALAAGDGYDGLRKAIRISSAALRELLEARLGRILTDKNSELQVAVEQIRPEELAGVAMNKPQSEESILRVKFIIDPLNGIPAHRLSPGNKSRSISSP